MRKKNNDNLTKIHLPIVKPVVFYPLPVERMGDKELHRTVVYNEMGNPYPQMMSAKQSFESYAMQIALEAGVSDPREVWTESLYGYQLADGEVFIPLTLQPFTPTVGYLNLFAIESLCINPYMGTSIYMIHDIIISCITTPETVMKKIDNADRFYDPEGLKHPKEGIPFKLIASPIALPEDIVVGNEIESPLALHTEKDIRLTYDLCGHILAMSPSKMLTGVKGLRQRLAPMIDKIDNDQKIRAQGLAAGNGKPIAIDPKSTAHEEMVPRSLLEAERAEKERYKKQNQHLLKALSVGNDEI